MTLPPKAVSTLCWIQCGGIVGSYLFVCTLNRCYTKLMFNFSGDSPRTLPWIAHSFVSFGSWLLVAPLIWALTAMTGADTEGGTVEISEKQVKFGYAITAALALICFGAVWEAFVGTFISPFQVN